MWGATMKHMREILKVAGHSNHTASMDMAGETTEISKTMVEAIIEALRDEDWEVQRAAATAKRKEVNKRIDLAKPGVGVSLFSRVALSEDD